MVSPICTVSDTHLLQHTSNRQEPQDLPPAPSRQEHSDDENQEEEDEEEEDEEAETQRAILQSLSTMHTSQHQTVTDTGGGEAVPEKEAEQAGDEDEDEELLRAIELSRSLNPQS